MVEISGQKLVKYALDAIIDAGIDKGISVIGHGAKGVQERSGNTWNGAEIE